MQRRVQLRAPTRGRGRTASRRRRARRRRSPTRRVLDHGREHARRNRQVVQRALRAAERVAQRRERRRRRVVAVDVAQQPTSFAKAASSTLAVLVDAVLGARSRAGPAFQPDSRHADDRHVELAAPHQRVQRGEDLLVGEIAGGAEEHQRVGVRPRRHRCFGPGLLDVAAEPEAHRGQHSGPAKSASPRELKRSYSAAASTWAGTASSIAALSVQRPSPESETRPANFVELRVCGERRGGQIEQPRRDHAAAPPDLGDVGAGRGRTGSAPGSRSGVVSASRPCGCLPTFGVLQDVAALGVRGHEAVLDAVVDHLHEVARRRRAAVQVAVLGGAAEPLAAGRARDGARRRAPARRRSDRAASRRRVRRRSSGSSRVRGRRRRRWCRSRRSGCRSAAEPLGAIDVVAVVGVAAVDDDVPRLEQGGQCLERSVYRGRRDHEPGDAWPGEVSCEVWWRSRPLLRGPGPPRPIHREPRTGARLA